MKYLKIYLNGLILLFVGLFLVLLHACNKNNEPKQDKKPWHHKDVMPQKFKWFLNADNYTDSNYKERFGKYYQEFLSQNHTDSALFCLLAYGEMIDQNYIFDSFYLKTAQEHLKKFEPISTVNGELVKLYYYIGSQYETNSEYPEAEKWFNIGIKHPDILPKTRIKCLGMLSEIYEGNNQAERAIELQLERLEFYEKEKDTINIAVTYNNIAGIYNSSHAFENAKQNNWIAINYSRLKNDTNTLIPLLSNYFIYEKNAADDFVFTAKHKAMLNEMNAICNSYSKLSPYNEWVQQDINFYYFYKENKTDSMKLTLDKIDKVIKIINSPSITHKYKFLTSIYQQKIGHLDLNEKELLEMAEIYEKREIWWEAWRTYMMLIELTESKGNYKNSLEYLRRSNEIVKKRTDLNNQGQLLDLEIRYQTAKKDQELAIRAEKLKTKQRDIGLLLASLIIVALVFLIYFVWQKKKMISEKSNNEILFTQKLMENTEDERMRIAKDLHDSVGHELLSIKNAMINKLQFTEDKIDHVLNEIREISRNLFPVMFEEVGLKISIDQLVENIKQTDNFYVGTEINYIAGTLSVKSELQVYRIIQEALNNTRKYANAQSAMISIIQEKNEILVVIKDNGKGFDVMDVLKSGKAFGLLAINQRCNALNTQANIVSDNEGTSISFQIPIKHV